jgi:hypothetical protein
MTIKKIKTTKRRIIVVTQLKGGCGKSTLAFQVITALVDIIACVIEIENEHDTTKIFMNSKQLKNKMKSIKPDEFTVVLGEALFDAIETGGDIIINGHLHEIIDTLKNSSSYDELIFICPFLRDRVEIQNIVSTLDELKSYKTLVIGNANTKEKFMFWNGSDKYDIPGVKAEYKKLPTVYIPQTEVFDLSSLYGETITDFAQLARDYTPDQIRQYLIEKANGDREWFKTQFSRYHISVACKNFIDNDLADMKKAIEILRDL